MGSPDPATIANDYTDDIQSLFCMMKELYPHLTERSAKIRSTKITNTLLKSISGLHSSGSDDELLSMFEEIKKLIELTFNLEDGSENHAMES